MDRPRRSCNTPKSGGVDPMAVDSSEDTPSISSSSSRKRHPQRLEPNKSKRQKLSFVKAVPPEPGSILSPAPRRRDTASKPPKPPTTLTSVPRSRTRTTSGTLVQDRTDGIPRLLTTQPPTTSIRINIVHSFGRITAHNIPRTTKLTELFKLHHAAGGRKPSKGLALQQTGRSEVVNGSFYWKSGDGPTNRYVWDEGNRMRVQDTEWVFVNGEGWLACIFSRKGWRERRRNDSGQDGEDGEEELESGEDEDEDEIGDEEDEEGEETD